jgi:histidine kinase
MHDHATVLIMEGENVEKIFEKFYRIDPSRAKDGDSFGIGLAICRKIVEMHGGTIWAESDGLGKGSRLNFTLPLPC